MWAEAGRNFTVEAHTCSISQTHIWIPKHICYSCWTENEKSELFNESRLVFWGGAIVNILHIMWRKCIEYRASLLPVHWRCITWLPKETPQGKRCARWLLTCTCRKAVGSGWSDHCLWISFIYMKQKPNRNRINLHLSAHRSITSFSVLSYYNLVCLGPGKKQKSFQTLSFVPIPFFLLITKHRS